MVEPFDRLDNAPASLPTATPALAAPGDQGSVVRRWRTPLTSHPPSPHAALPDLHRTAPRGHIGRFRPGPGRGGVILAGHFTTTGGILCHFRRCCPQVLAWFAAIAARFASFSAHFAQMHTGSIRETSALA